MKTWFQWRPRSGNLAAALKIGAVCTAIVLFSGYATAEPTRDLYAVVVGVNKYKDPNIPGLTRSDTDARDFHNFIKENQTAFSKVHLTLLLNEQATRANLASALRQNLKPAAKDDIVIVYLSGHGATDPSMPNEFYFLSHDAHLDNLFGTALLMNDANLFKGMDCKNVLLLADACHSGGFGSSLDGATAKSAEKFLTLLQGTKGRVAITSSRPDELSYEKPIFGNSVFTHFLLKGLRGDAEGQSSSEVITAKNLYDYIYRNTKAATKGLQSPQLYCAKGTEESTPVFLVPKFAGPLGIKVQFFYEDEQKNVRPLSEESSLKSGAYVGVAFQSQSDCWVYIYWWDSSGNVGRLFPNPELTEGRGEVKAGRTYWLPSRGGEQWYMLDDNPGLETIYFVASRQRNLRLERLYEDSVSSTAVTPEAARQQIQPPPGGSSSRPAPASTRSSTSSGAAPSAAKPKTDQARGTASKKNEARTQLDGLCQAHSGEISATRGLPQQRSGF